MQQINTVKEFFEIFSSYRTSTQYRFRGQSKSGWPLIPKVARKPFDHKHDFEIFRNWKRRAKGLLNKENSSEIDLLTIAQHYGLATRLLDWTMNPLIAAFFACNQHFDTDGELFIVKSSVIHSEKINDLFQDKIKSVVFIQPDGTSLRLNNQFGYFSLHNPADQEVSKQNQPSLESLIIPKNIKRELLFALNQYGINNLSVYPDLEGLTRHLNWFYSNYNEWDNSN
ncbi:FRG domain-containing protein [Roseivirga pacifica]